MTDWDQRNAAKKFAADWEGKGYEKGENQPFWLSLLRDVCGVDHPEKFISFEKTVQAGNNKKTTQFIDGYIKDTKVLIEQKNSNIDLNRPTRQSDGTWLTPYQQAKRYMMSLPVSEHPNWIVTCNFNSFYIYDMDQPNCEPEKVMLKNLPKEYYRLRFLVDKNDSQTGKVYPPSIEAGEIVGKIYDALRAQYKDKDSAHTLHSLNVLCVRIVFCLYAEKSGLFEQHGLFLQYIMSYSSGELRNALADLFKVLDTKEGERESLFEGKDLAGKDKYLSRFPYVNGGLFNDNSIEIPQINEEIKDLLMGVCEKFDWSLISPTIFGAVFESTLNPETRRSGGMHYTSVENIHKVIDPLFLDDLTKEFDDICLIKSKSARNRRFADFKSKLASLTFLDPACGSGNFLTETYLSLRRLENKVIMCEQADGQIIFGDLIQVNLNQLYGLEINDFAVTVAKTALWIAESQMISETETIVNSRIEFLPLKSNTNIVEGNAVKEDWDEIIPKEKLSYIMGNPPFNGARLMSAAQKDDVNFAFPNWKNVGNLDYVSCWFKKASDLMKGTSIRSALVATNSIVQGDSVATLWKPLMEDGLHIDFAYRTFRWDSEAKIKAHVHCVIIGFSRAPYRKEKRIYTDSGYEAAENINAYLVDSEDIFVESRPSPLCDVPEVGIGNKPIDNGNYLFTKKEMEEFIKAEPASEKYFRPWYGAEEFINSRPRYCLWLGDCPTEELVKMPKCMERVTAVREYRYGSKSEGTRKIADKPTRFHVENMPKGNYIVIPEVSSEKRSYIPMGYMDDTVLCSNRLKLLPGASLYQFGILNSNVHMDWMRYVCGRLEMRYVYSIFIVYNNFPWPTPTKEQKEKIEQTAWGILDTRKRYPKSTLGDMYGEKMYLYADLLKAHQENDKAVMAAYGWGPKDEEFKNESARVASLLKLYQKLTS